MSILVILLEDEYWVRKSMVRLCSTLPDVKVVGEFEDAAQALAFARETHIDAAIIDILLPDNSGLEIGNALKAEFPDLKLIFTSAGDSYEPQIQEYGGDAFLHKPITLKELRYALGLTNQTEL